MFRLLFVSALLFFLGYGIFSFLARFWAGNRNQSNRQQYNTPPQQQQDESKRFTKDVGEYVPYEEVKDEEK